MKRLLTAAVLCTVLILGSVWSVRAVDNTAQAVALDVENSALCCCTARLIRLTGCLTVCLPRSKTA